MKKLGTFFGTLLFMLFMQTHSLAADDKPGTQYFGVGATIQEVGDGEFIVKTEGKKSEEGFVFSPKEKFTTEKIQLQVTLKGKGTVVVRISETNARGQFIKEANLTVQLTEDWATYGMPFTLESQSSQLDVFVVTKSEAETEFSVKDLTISSQ